MVLIEFTKVSKKELHKFQLGVKSLGDLVLGESSQMNELLLKIKKSASPESKRSLSQVTILE